MIRNIIFDIGNVLTDYRWEGFLADKGFDAEMIQKIAKASVMHPAWQSMIAVPGRMNRYWLRL